MSFRGAIHEAVSKTGGGAVFPSARQPGMSMKYARVDRCVRRGGIGRRGAGMPCPRFVVQAVAAPGGFTAWDTAVQRVPKRTDIKTIMLLGAGPIVIGQVRGRISSSCGFQNCVGARSLRRARAGGVGGRHGVLTCVFVFPSFVAFGRLWSPLVVFRRLSSSFVVFRRLSSSFAFSRLPGRRAPVRSPRQRPGARRGKGSRDQSNAVGASSRPAHCFLTCANATTGVRV